MMIGGDMRELPKPDIYPAGCVHAYTKELVLSIQKQAYEDGLMGAPDGYMLVPIEPTTAMKEAAIKAGEQAHIEHVNHALADGPEPQFQTAAEAIYSSMLTSSQKRD